LKNVATLNDGDSIPVIGLGVFQAPTDAEQAISAALRAGYRQSDVPCDQLYVVTTLPNLGPGYDGVPVDATGIVPAVDQRRGRHWAGAAGRAPGC
jgi:hypothetical protein